MATVNIRDAYDLLQQVLRQQDLQRQGVGFDSSADGAPGYAGSNDDSGRGGLLGRLAALQAEQSQYQPGGGNGGPTPSQPRDPNFRQVSRAAIGSRPQGETGGFNRREDRRNLYFPVAHVASPDVVPESNQGSEDFGARSEGQSPVIAGFPRIGGAIPMPPMGPGTLRPIPVPQLPEWWRATQELLKLYSRMRRGGGGGNRRKNDDAYCYEREQAEKQRCFENAEDYPHWDYESACRDRASIRRDMCVRNEGRPDPMEPGEWGRRDEEIYDRDFMREPRR